MTELGPRTCDYCGVTFTPTRSSQRFHSAECRIAHGVEVQRRKREAAKLPEVEKVCAQCGVNRFTTTRLERLYCSDRCRWLAAWERKSRAGKGPS